MYGARQNIRVLLHFSMKRLPNSHLLFSLYYSVVRVHAVRKGMLAPWLVLFQCTVRDGQGIVNIVRGWLYEERMCTDHTGLRSKTEYEMQERTVDADGNVLMV